MTQQLLQIGLYIMGAIGTIVTAASAAAKFIDPLSKLGQWVAWVASCPIGHSPRVIAPVLLPTTAAKKVKAISDAMADSGRMLVLLVAIGSLPMLNGCAGTLEETRGSVKMRALLGAQVAPVNRAECQRLSRLESISTILASGLAFAAGASGVATVPVRSANSKTALAITALSLGALSASSVAAETRFRAEWQQAGCDQ
jgi:hypothetical protein